MPMHRNQPLLEQPLPQYLMPSAELVRLQGLFRRALQVVFASSLAAVSGCPQSEGTAADPVITAGTGPGANAGTGSAGTVGAQAGTLAQAGSSGTPAAGSGGGRQAMPEDEDAGVVETAGAGGSVAIAAIAPVCEANLPELLADLRPATPFDFAALRTVYGSDSADNFFERTSTGTACANATDGATCEAALKATSVGLDLTDNCGMLRGGCRSYLVTTHGSDVKRYVTREELLVFLGPIDASQDAYLLLDFDGYGVNCSYSSVTPISDGFEFTVRRQVNTCPFQDELVRGTITRAGVVNVLSRTLLPISEPAVCAGRRPAGWVASTGLRDGSGSVLGAYFATMAELEAASVAAFRILADELALHGAPLQLIAAAQAAAEDEVRHTQLTAALAERFGGLPKQPFIEPRAPRSLEALALDNAVEGCVRETFGAAVGCHQAESSTDPLVAQVMQIIAADETRHAALSLRVHAWLWPQLTDAARTRVTHAQKAAVAELLQSLQQPCAAALCDTAGLPDTRQSLQLFAALSSELWPNAPAVSSEV